jgi:hypothetical protein
MENDDHDPADLSHWPEAFLASVGEDEDEDWSLLMIEIGLGHGNLEALASHLRKGFPLSPAVAKKIADAIENKPEAKCQISAKRLNAGNPHRGGSDLHTEYTRIGRMAEKALLGAKRGESAQRLHAALGELNLSPSKIKAARKYYKEWIQQLTDSIPLWARDIEFEK